MPTDQITFRTNDMTRWGAGNGMDLTASQIDINFWVLYTAIVALQDHAETNGAGIADFIVSGDTFSVQLTNHVVLGPFALPVAAFNWRGPWQENASYSINDTFTAIDNQGQTALFLVIWPVPNSGATFFQGSNDGNGHDFYAEVLAAPPPELPAGALPGQVLGWGGPSPDGAVWTNLTRNIAFYIETEPNPLERVVIYTVPETMTFPEGLVGSVGYVGDGPTSEQQYEIYWNNANVGSINVAASPGDEVTFTFNHAITMEPGDVLTIFAPTVPDPHMGLLAVTLVGTLP
jgi:hypothetical protein